MGWTYCEKGTRETPAMFFAREFPSIEFVGTATTLHVFYAACRTRREGVGDSDQVWAMVCKIDHKGDGMFPWGYKDMDETMGPNEDACPERIMKLLTPFEGDCVMTEEYGIQRCQTHGYACSWRARCWANIEARKRKPKLVDGCTLRLAHPLTFTNGDVVQTFSVRIEKTRRGGIRKTFFAAGSYRAYRLGDIKKYSYTILPAN